MVLPYIDMNPPQVYTCSPSWTPLPHPSPYHPSGSSQCTSPKHPVSCIEPGLATSFIHDIIHVSVPFSQIIPPYPSSTECKRLFCTSVSLLLSCTQGYCYHLSKFHIYALVYCIGVFLYGLLHSVYYEITHSKILWKFDCFLNTQHCFEIISLCGLNFLRLRFKLTADWLVYWKEKIQKLF